MSIFTTESPIQPTLTAAPRQTWVLWAMGLPIGFLINGLTGGIEHMPQALLTLLGWLSDPNQLQRHTVRLVSNMVLPGLAAFLVLRLTPLGRWLAPNRLALGCLLLASGLLVAIALQGVYLASINEPPFLRGLASTIVSPVLVTTMVAGLGSLALSTIWHRLLAHRAKAVAVCQGLFREV